MTMVSVRGQIGTVGAGGRDRARGVSGFTPG